MSDKGDCHSPPPHLSSSPGAIDTCSPVTIEKGEDRVTDDTCTAVKFEKGEDCATQSEPCDTCSPSGEEPPFKMPEEPEFVCGVDKLLAANEGTSGSEPDHKPSTTVSHFAISHVKTVVYKKWFRL